MVLTVGSRAMSECEPRQAGNRAAISISRDVPRGCLTRANCMISAYKTVSISGCTTKNCLILPPQAAFFLLYNGRATYGISGALSQMATENL